MRRKSYALWWWSTLHLVRLDFDRVHPRCNWVVRIQRLEMGNRLKNTNSLTNGRLVKEINRLIGLLNSSRRQVVKSALSEIRDLKNTINKDLARSYEIDRSIRARREEFAIKRMIAGGHIPWSLTVSQKDLYRMYDFYWWQNYRRLKNQTCPKCTANLFRNITSDVRLCLECDWIEPDLERTKRHELNRFTDQWVNSMN